MDGSLLERKIAEAEDRVRRLLMQSCSDDSYSCQSDLREAVEQLRELRGQRWPAEEELHTVH